MTPLKFRLDFYHQKTAVLDYHTAILVQCRLVMTNEWMDEHMTTANTALVIAYYGPKVETLPSLCMRIMQ